MPSAKSDCLYAGSTAVVIGGGLLGGSWAALFLVNGLKVIICDRDPDLAINARAIINGALPALWALGYSEARVDDNLSFEGDVAAAVATADIIQECGPDEVESKQALWKAIEAAAPGVALLCSSSSLIPASVQGARMNHPGRLVIGHPFEAPHIMPLVEVVPAPHTHPAVTDRAIAFYRGIGKTAVAVRREIGGYVANRLRIAIFQEAVHLISEGVVTLDELDQVVTGSLGIVCASCGPFLSLHIAEGPGGLMKFLGRPGPATESAWGRLGILPIDQATKRLMSDQLETSYAASSFLALAELKEEREIAVINGLARIESAV